MVILDRAEIEGLIDLSVAGTAIEQAYVAASRGLVNLPPVGHITFPDVAADCHIKYGHMHGDPHFVVKIATGFPHNTEQGLPTGNGLSLVLSAQTGVVMAMLHDEMVLTDIRTGLGGAIATRTLARADSTDMLIVGTGPQALRQIESHLAWIGGHLTFKVWGRAAHKAEAIAQTMKDRCTITAVTDLETAVRSADIIVTTTGATAPLIKADWVAQGTHITAVGADAPGKQELETQLVAQADVLVADSGAQCLDHGEVSHAFASATPVTAALVELGHALSEEAQGRTDAQQISIADLTGIAAQDIAIARVVLEAKGVA